jgi:hypothetical protein
MLISGLFAEIRKFNWETELRIFSIHSEYLIGGKREIARK